jgi:hypothetical protein
MSESFRPVTINFGAVKVSGAAGIPLLAIVALIAVVFLEARWLLLSGMMAGVMMGTVLILVRRRRSFVPQGHHWIDPAGD